MKTKFLVFAILLITCLPKGIQAINYLQQSHAKQDTASMKKYQTFDEFTMRGIGTAKASPFVYVKEMGDSIYVVSSCPKDSARLYVKIDDNLWYNHMEFYMWKKDSMAYKCKECRIAKTYDRYIYNDTITEVCIGYIEGEAYPSVIVKTQNKLYNIPLYDDKSSEYANIAELRKFVYDITHSTAKNVFQSELKESDTTYFYVNNKGKCEYEYEKKAYGIWGIQPGFEETFLFEGIDVREYSDNLKDFQKKNPNFIYSYSDIPPEYPNGMMAFIIFLKEKIDSSLITEDKKARVIFDVIIEKDGSITNPVLTKGIDKSHDDDALNIIRQIPKWIPAQLNGIPIRYKTNIVISYNKFYYDRLYR